MRISVCLTSFSIFDGIHWLFPLQNGGLGAGCGGEMFPSSGGRTDPGRGFRPRAGVMLPPGQHSLSLLLHALLSWCHLQGQDVQPRRANKMDFQHSVSSSELLSLLWQLGALEWELLVLSPSLSSSVVVYLLRADHKPCRASPGKKQLRTVIFMEIVKQ